MTNYHGSIYHIVEGRPVFLEYAQLHVDGEVQYIEIISENLHDKEWEILLGEFNDFDHREVTFIACRTGGYSGGAAYRYKIWFDFGFAGCHFLSIEEIKTTEVCLFLPPLTEWLTDSDLGRSLIRDFESKSFKIPEVTDVSKSKIGDLEVTVQITYPYTSSNEKFQIERSTLIIFRSDENQDFHFFRDQVNKFKKLFLLISNINPEPSTLSFKDIGMGINKTPLGWFKLVGEHVEPKNVKFRDTAQLHFSELRNQFSVLIENWFKKVDLAAVIDLILEKRYNTDLSLKSYFLNLVVAVESFTDIAKPKELFPDLKIRHERRNEISELITDIELRQWFRENTVYWKTPETKDRLLIYSDTIELLMSNTFNFGVFDMISKMKKARDLIAHTGSYAKVFSPLELLMTSKILEYTVRAELLKIMLPESKKIVDEFLSEGMNQVKYIARANKYIAENKDQV